MIRRWGLPLLTGLVVAVVAHHVTLVQTPRMLMALASRRISSVVGYNRLFQAPLPTAAARAIVRPSPDLAYASCPFDLSKGPLLVDVYRAARVQRGLSAGKLRPGRCRASRSPENHRF